MLIVWHDDDGKLQHISQPFKPEKISTKQEIDLYGRAKI